MGQFFISGKEEEADDTGYRTMAIAASKKCICHFVLKPVMDLNGKTQRNPAVSPFHILLIERK